MTTQLISLKNRPKLSDFNTQEHTKRSSSNAATSNMIARNLMSPREHLLAFKKEKRPPSMILRMQQMTPASEKRAPVVEPEIKRLLREQIANA